MTGLTDSLIGAGKLILTFDSELVSITVLTLYVSLFGAIAAGLIAAPFGILLGLKNFRGKGIVVNIINTFMGLPPVIVGLLLYVLFSRQGALGNTGLLFTPQIMVLAQFIIAFPIITGVTLSAMQGLEKDVHELIVSLGSTKTQRMSLIFFEIRYGLITAFMAGLGRAFSEVGAVIIVGGNIRNHTRVLTTSIVLETSRGEFEQAMALGIILLALVFVINYGITILQGESQR